MEAVVERDLKSRAIGGRNACLAYCRHTSPFPYSKMTAAASFRIPHVDAYRQFADALLIQTWPADGLRQPGVAR